MSEIRLLSTTAMKTTIDELVESFERSTGHTLAPDYAPSAQIARRVAAGEQADVAIATPLGIDDLIGQGRIVAGTRADIARSAIALAVRKGAPKPDISSAEKFRQALLAAKSIATSAPVGGGQSGAHLVRIFERLGITEAMKPKTLHGPGGPAGLIGLFLVRGEAEIGIQQLSELMAVPDIDIVGPLPDEIQVYTVFAAGLATAARDAAAGRALIAHLTTPAAAAVLQAKGLERA